MKVIKSVCDIGQFERYAEKIEHDQKVSMSYKTLLSVADAFQRKYSNIANPVGCISRNDYFMFGGTPVVIDNSLEFGEVRTVTLMPY